MMIQADLESGEFKENTEVAKEVASRLDYKGFLEDIKFLDAKEPGEATTMDATGLIEAQAGFRTKSMEDGCVFQIGLAGLSFSSRQNRKLVRLIFYEGEFGIKLFAQFRKAIYWYPVFARDVAESVQPVFKFLKAATVQINIGNDILDSVHCLFRFYECTIDRLGSIVEDINGIFGNPFEVR